MANMVCWDHHLQAERSNSQRYVKDIVFRAIFPQLVSVPILKYGMRYICSALRFYPSMWMTQWIHIHLMWMNWWSIEWFIPVTMKLIWHPIPANFNHFPLNCDPVKLLEIMFALEIYLQYKNSHYFNFFLIIND